MTWADMLTWGLLAAAGGYLLYSIFTMPSGIEHRWEERPMIEPLGVKDYIELGLVAAHRCDVPPDARIQLTRNSRSVSILRSEPDELGQVLAEEVVLTRLFFRGHMLGMAYDEATNTLLVGADAGLDVGRETDGQARQERVCDR